jgi:hypothetical protein
VDPHGQVTERTAFFGAALLGRCSAMRWAAYVTRRKRRFEPTRPNRAMPITLSVRRLSVRPAAHRSDWHLGPSAGLAHHR